jgi:hypothetical protein
MKRLNYMLAVAGGGVAMLLSPGSGSAQPQDNPPPGGPGGGGRGRGNFDPEQMRQRMMERVKEQLEVTKDDEWKALEPLVTKVFEARREAMTSGMRGFMGRGPRGGDNAGNDQGNRRRFGPEQGAEELALEKAIESKASKEELKAAMAKFRAAKKDKEVKMKGAQEELRKVLTLRQEAIAVANGWLD